MILSRYLQYLVFNRDGFTLSLTAYIYYLKDDYRFIEKSIYLSDYIMKLLRTSNDSKYKIRVAPRKMFVPNCTSIASRNSLNKSD